MNTNSNRSLVLGTLFLGLLQAAHAHAAKPTVMAVFAHPDDETFVSPLLAKLATAGHTVVLVTVTSGQLGADNTDIKPGAALGAAREKELKCAATTLGLTAVEPLGFQDQGLATTAAMWDLNIRLREMIDRYKPEVIITWGPEGVTGAIDHILTGNAVTQVFQHRDLLHHIPKKLYYVGQAESLFAPMKKKDSRLVADRFLTTTVDVTGFADVAAQAAGCHKTQWTPDTVEHFRKTFTEVQKGKLFLRLALSDVPLRKGGETSVFDGLAMR